MWGLVSVTTLQLSEGTDMNLKPSRKMSLGRNVKPVSIREE